MLSLCQTQTGMAGISGKAGKRIPGVRLLSARPNIGIYYLPLFIPYAPKPGIFSTAVFGAFLPVSYAVAGTITGIA